MDDFTFNHYISLKLELALVMGWVDILRDDVDSYLNYLIEKNKHKKVD
jgi:hypothetical protein